jgi:hypothetical protein
MQTQRALRSVSAALNSSGKYKFRSPEFDVDYLVIGGGSLAYRWKCSLLTDSSIRGGRACHCASPSSRKTKQFDVSSREKHKSGGRDKVT